MLLLLGFEVTMMAAIFGKQVYLVSLLIIMLVVTLSVAVRLPSTCEIQILNVSLTDLMVNIIGEERGDMGLIEVISLDVHHLISASFSLKASWNISMVINEIIVGEKLIGIERIMVLNFQD